MVDFSAIISNLVDIGFYSVILPFILVYAVVFAILEKSGIFNKKSTDESNKQTKNVNAIIAFVFGLFTVAATQTVIWMQSFITSMITFIIFILVVLILLGFIFGDEYTKLFKDKDGNFNKGITYTIAAIVILIALVVLAIITGAWDTILDWFDDNLIGNDTIATVLIIAAIGFVIYWISKEDKPAKSGG